MEIEFGNPYRIKEGYATKYRREWVIPSELLSGFFSYWRLNKIKLLADGFRLYQNKSNNKWVLQETKSNIALLKNYTPKENKLPPVDVLELQPYAIKNATGLRDWQIPSVEKLVSVLNKNESAIDGSSCGSGKSYVSCAVARELNYKIVVVCPKAVIKQWTKVICNHFDLKDSLIGVINYEKLKVGKSNKEIAGYILDRKKGRKVFTWNIPKDTLIIWDESQKLKNWKTKNAKMCLQAMKQGYKMLFLSATNAINPLEMRVTGKALKLFTDYYDWVYKHGVFQGDWGLEFNNNADVLRKLNKDVFQYRGVRLRIDDIPNFPPCDIISEPYNMDEEETSQINRVNSEMCSELEKLKQLQKTDEEHQLTIRLRARQQTELIKVPLFIDMIEEGLENGFSVAVFLNFTDTINAIAKRLNISCIYDGILADRIREKNKEDFQANLQRVILINSASGGAGLSLHDIYGEHPRLALISPNDSASIIKQVLGRVWRDDAKTKSIQKIVFVANTTEEDVCINVQQKLKNLDLLNDGDLAVYQKLI